ncbi:MAG TPA: hypothetical protein DCY52_00975, partial [Methylococcaceae bacterium]|nr:hypothetical protein [Methylococcaceae bacterium]
MKFAIRQQEVSTGPAGETPAHLVHVPHLILSQAKRCRIIEQGFDKYRISALILIEKVCAKLVLKARPGRPARGFDHFKAVIGITAFELPKTNAPLNGTDRIALTY